jgi:hypothetical protein
MLEVNLPDAMWEAVACSKFRFISSVLIIWSSENLKAFVITSTWFFLASFDKGLSNVVSDEKESSILDNPFWLPKAD